MTPLVGIGSYLLLGLLALLVFDLATKRIRNGITAASRGTQTKLVNSGSFAGERVALMLTLLAIWIFWPVVFYGAVEKRIRKE